MSVPDGYKTKQKQKQQNKTKQKKTKFTNLIENEIAGLTRIKTQFGLLVKLLIVRNNETTHGAIFQTK